MSQDEILKLILEKLEKIEMIMQCQHRNYYRYASAQQIETCPDCGQKMNGYLSGKIYGG